MELKGNKSYQLCRKVDVVAKSMVLEEYENSEVHLTPLFIISEDAALFPCGLRL